MALEFEDVFAGEGVWRGEEEGDSRVDGDPEGVPEIPVYGAPGSGYTPEDLLGDVSGFWSGDANNANAAAPGRGGGRSDGGGFCRGGF